MAVFNHTFQPRSSVTTQGLCLMTGARRDFNSLPMGTVSYTCRWVIKTEFRPLTYGVTVVRLGNPSISCRCQAMVSYYKEITLFYSQTDPHEQNHQKYMLFQISSKAWTKLSKASKSVFSNIATVVNCYESQHPYLSEIVFAVNRSQNLLI